MENQERELINKLFQNKYGAGGPSGYGLTASVFIDGDVAAKVYGRSIPKEEVFKEAYMLAYVERAGIETSKVLSVGLESDFWVLRMTAVRGVSMLQTLFEKLFSGDFDGALADTRKMAEIHAGINRTDGRALPSYKRYAASVISGNPSLSDGCRAKLLALLETLPDAEAICHGDIHPNNILVDAGGGWTVIDWPEVTSGSPCADASRTYVNMCRFADLSGFLSRIPESPELFARLTAEDIARSESVNLMETYLQHYCSVMGIEPGEVLRWLPIQAGMLYGYKEEDICTFLEPYLL